VRLAWSSLSSDLDAGSLLAELSESGDDEGVAGLGKGNGRVISPRLSNEAVRRLHALADAHRADGHRSGRLRAKRAYVASDCH